MPAPVSKKQFRMMMAIAHEGSRHGGGKGGKSSVKTARGDSGPNRAVAGKYAQAAKDADYDSLPESKGKEQEGGIWEEKHHEKAHGKTKEARHKKRKEKSKKHLKKTEDIYKAEKINSENKAAAVIVIDNENKILLGQHEDGLAVPGGSMDPEDMGSYELNALRELKEEANIAGRNPIKVWEGNDNGTHVQVFVVENWTGEPKGGDELKNFKWYSPEKIDWSKVRKCCIPSLKSFVEQKLGKSLIGMVALENLHKNIIRERGSAVFEATHGDALRIVGNGLFRKIRQEVKDMKDESFKEFKVDTYTVHIRKHINDVYSGRVVDGHKVIFQFTNKSLPEVTIALMSVFEWYLPEDEKELELLDESKLSDDVIAGGLNKLMDNYKKHNIGNIYEEIEHIREQMRNGVAVDLQQVEARIMTLFDKLESIVHDVAGKHNAMLDIADKEFDEINLKLRELQSKIDDVSKKPETIEAITSHKSNPDHVHDESYPYLPRPQIEISPNGKIRITFQSEWTDLEKENFLRDLRAKAIKRGKSK